MPSDLLLIAPHSGGHHGEHVRWLLKAAHQRGASVSLAAAPSLLDALRHDFDYVPDVAEVVALRSTERAIGLTGLGAVRAARAVLTEAVERASAPHAFLTWMDQGIGALATGFRPATQLSGLLFRLPFPESDPSTPSLRRLLKKALLRRAGVNPSLGTVFTLDPDGPEALSRLGVNGAYTPDPVEPVRPTASRDDVRAAYGVEPGRRLGILFGSLEIRKGPLALAAALHELAPEAARRLAVVVAGKTYDDIRPLLTAAFDRVRRETEVQLVFREGFVPDAALADLTAAADVVLAPYLGHVGSSGVVVRAAAAGTPLIAQDAAQIGREVRRHRLGRTVDPADASALASALSAFVHDPTGHFDAAEAAAYADAHHVARFTDAILNGLLGAP